MATAPHRQDYSSKSKLSSIVDSFTSGEKASVGGLVCNDQQGLCLLCEGNMKEESSGVYSSLTRLASELSPMKEESSGSSARNSVPLITLETSSAATLIKEYDGYPVAIKVPVNYKETPSGN